MASERSRFEDVSRRAFMKGSLAAGLSAGAFGLAACGSKNDAKVFASGSSTTATGTTAVTSGAATGRATGTAAASVAPTTKPGTTTTAAASAGNALPAGAELQIAFTFGSASGGGPAKNPFIAVWIEDAAGAMVQTVSVWLESGKGQKWWPELTRWYQRDTKRAAAGGPATADTVTGATRTAGDQSVVWKGTRYGGATVAQGSYFVCIEAAREHGPYELIRETLTLGSKAFTQALTPNGELTKASVSYVA